MIHTIMSFHNLPQQLTDDVRAHVHGARYVLGFGDAHKVKWLIVDVRSLTQQIITIINDAHSQP